MAFRNIAVIGVGGVGGYFGGKLCRLVRSAPPRHVSFVARGDHLLAIRRSGLRLCSERDGDLVCHPSLATDVFAELPTPDLVLLCVKQFDLHPVLEALSERIGNDTVVLPLLNGMDVQDRIRAVLTRGIVLPACVYVGTHLESPGHVRQKGGACRILAGPDPRRPDFQPEELLGLLAESGIETEWTAGIASEIWQKFVFIAGFGLVTAAHDRSLGETLADPALRDEVAGVMSEAIGLARVLGVPLPEDILDRSLAKARTFPPEARTSFQRDFARPDRKDERELFAGAMVRLASRLGREIPMTRGLADTLERGKPTRPEPLS